MSEKIYMIDTTSPFFVRHKKKKVNWSKVPFYHLEKQGELGDKNSGKIKNYFQLYIDQIKEMGYNAISIDEICYIALLDFYNPDLKAKLKRYRRLFGTLFDIAKSAGMKIFVTTDIMFYNEDIDNYINTSNKTEFDVLKDAIIDIFDSYKEVDGVIFRIGESDGLDTLGEFKSRLYLKSKKDANTLIKDILPVFEERDKTLIFRTWTVGAYGLGDLMWNKKTYNTVFDGINSKNFIISMKFGDTDFFRYLNLNPHFFNDNKQKIIELQTRREYEGFGEFPSFVGWDYKDYYDKLKDNSSLIGITVWCQTGGWSTFKNHTFLKNTSFWNELNTYVTIKIFRDNLSVEDAIKSFEPSINGEKLVEFLRLADDIIKHLLYDPNYSSRELYFNKVRIPPLIHVFWNNVTLTNFTMLFYNAFCEDTEDSVKKGYDSLEKINKLSELAKEAKIPQYNYEFQYDTFFMFAKGRELMYGEKKKSKIKEYKKLAKEYKEKYPKTYRFYIKISRKKRFIFLSMLVKMLVREKKEYRLIDRILFNRVTSYVYMFLYKIAQKRFPKFLNNQAMPVETLFK